MSALHPGQVQLQDPALVAELVARTRTEVADLAGVVVASRDGLVVVADIDPDLAAITPTAPMPTGRRATFATPDTAATISAMAAVAAGVGTQFVQASGTGTLQAVTVEGARGCTGVFPLTSALLLVLFGAPQVTMGRFVVAAKQAVAVMLGPTAG